MSNIKDYIIKYENEFDVLRLEGIGHIIDNNPSLNIVRIRMEEGRADVVESIIGIKNVKLFEENA